MNSAKTMLLITAMWNGNKSFRMIPASIDAPFNEVIFDPEVGQMAVIGKCTMETPKLIPKVDQNGDLMKLRKVRENGKFYAEERRMLHSYYEYYISEIEEIRAFICHFALNADIFNYEIYLVPAVTDETAKLDSVGEIK